METIPPAFGKPVRTPWEDFPEVILHSSIWKLKSLPEYQAAKKGNARAAQALVQWLIKPTQINLHVDFVVPVVQIDRGHFNAIPVAFGALLAKSLKAKLWLGISQMNVVSHTASSAVERILHQPVFGGVAPRGTCLICDDVVTYGSSLANLRGFLENQGSRVLAATTIAAGYGSTRLRPEANLLNRIQNRYAEELKKITQTFGFGSDCLTGRETYFFDQLRTADHLRTVFAPVLGPSNRSRGIRI